VSNKRAHLRIRPELLRLRAAIESTFGYADRAECLVRQSISLADEIGLPW